MGGQPTLYRKKGNLNNMLPLMLFNMFLLCSSLVSTVCSLSGRGAGTSTVDTSIGPVLLNDFAVRVGMP